MSSALAASAGPISSAELQLLARSRPELRLIDVRTPGEHESLRIPGSYNIPVDCVGRYAPTIRDRGHEPLVLVCQTGQRAREARAVLERAGVRDVRVLDGGILGWAAAGGTVERGAQRLSLERQVRIAAGLLAAVGAALALLVHPTFALLPLVVGSGLTFAGITNICGMARLLAHLPYNRPASVDVDAVVEALARGAPPPAAAHDSHPAGRRPGCAMG